jgi:gamma-glutamyltranspeptidase/glutathione hydrolase
MPGFEARGWEAVATANPLATDAAMAILGAGGSAVDAAIAAQAVLTLAEPSASGIGGGAIILMAAGGTVRVFEGLAAAPGAIAVREGQPEFGGCSVGVPGAVRAMAMAHAAGGRLAWRALFAPAIALASEGAPLAPYLRRRLGEAPAMREEPLARALWFGERGAARAAGTKFRNPELAESLALVAEQGADAFYEGTLAERMVAAVRNDRHPGTLAASDLAAYRARERAPVRFPLGAWTVAAPPPPAGGITVGQIVGLVRRLGLTGIGAEFAPEAMHLLAEAGRIAYADRPLMGDPEAMAIDAALLLEPAYLDARALLLDPGRRVRSYPQGIEAPIAELTDQESMTSHLSVADRRGNFVSMTTTINQLFGARIAVGGFYLNDAIGNFGAGSSAANAPGPGKRPRTTMAPAIVLDHANRPIAALGAGGGHRIVGMMANLLLRLAGGARDAASLVAAPHALRWRAETEIEPPLAEHRAALAALGHRVKVQRFDGAAQAVLMGPDGMSAGGDPRRDGTGIARQA